MTGSFDPWRSGDRKRRRSPGGFTVSGGALSFTHLTGGSDTTTEPTTTASITPSANTPVFCAVIVAVEGGGQTGNADSMSVSGCNLTWEQVGRVHYEADTNRRSVYVFRGYGASPTTGSLTIDFTSGLSATWTEHVWSVDECSNATTTLPTAYTNNSATGVTTLSITVSETPDAGDFVYAAFGIETSGTINITLGAELDTELYNLENSTDCRAIEAAYDSAPDSTPTPSVSWTGAGSCAGVAFVVNTA